MCLFSIFTVPVAIAIANTGGASSSSGGTIPLLGLPTGSLPVAQGLYFVLGFTSFAPHMLIGLTAALTWVIAR